jgi:hypothetical protein
MRCQDPFVTVSHARHPGRLASQLKIISVKSRLTEIHDNLLARIEEAHREGWAGEAEGLKVSLAAARQKLAQMSEISAHHRDTAVHLGMPAHPGAASRATTAPGLPGKEPS